MADEEREGPGIGDRFVGAAEGGAGGAVGSVTTGASIGNTVGEYGRWINPVGEGAAYLAGAGAGAILGDTAGEWVRDGVGVVTNPLGTAVEIAGTAVGAVGGAIASPVAGAYGAISGAWNGPAADQIAAAREERNSEFSNGVSPSSTPGDKQAGVNLGV